MMAECLTPPPLGAAETGAHFTWSKWVWTHTQGSKGFYSIVKQKFGVGDCSGEGACAIVHLLPFRKQTHLPSA